MKGCRLILALITVWLAGCSNQWREGDAQVTADEMMAMLSEVESTQGQSFTGGSISEALALKNDPNVRIYFGYSTGDKLSPMGPVASIVSLTSFDFLGAGPDLWWGNLQQARVFFMDLPSAGGRQAGLILSLMKTGEGTFTHYGLVGQGSVSDGEFVAVLQSNGADKLVVRTYDTTDDGDLMDTIQLKVWEVDGAGNEVYIGKFSTLVGFGP